MPAPRIRRASPSVLALAGLVLATGAARPVQAQSVQYRSPAGVDYRAQADTGPIARAEQALAAEPRSVDRLIALGIAQSGARQFREAIATFTRGLAIAPDDARLWRWRGHRWLSVRELDRATADLTRGYALDSTSYGILYHLGVVRFARGDFLGAADMFRRAIPRAPDAGELAGSTDWLWMSLMRAGLVNEARTHLARRTDSLPVSNAYAARLRLYRGEIGPDRLFTPADTADVQVATLAYGLGNWHMVRGDTAAARAAFERAVRSGGWPGFGFIVAEAELARLQRSGSTAAPPAADPRDVGTIEDIIRVSYEVLNGPAGTPRQWRRDSTLYAPGTFYVAMSERDGRPVARQMTAEEFRQRSFPALERSGFFETEIGRHVDRFGHVAQVRSVYELRYSRTGRVEGRGVNYFLLHHDGTRWWITGMVWDDERPNNPIPKEWIGRTTSNAR